MKFKYLSKMFRFNDKKYLKIPYKLYFLYGIKNIIYYFNKKIKGYVFYYLNKKFINYNFLLKKKSILVTQHSCIKNTKKYVIYLRNYSFKKKILRQIIKFNLYKNNVLNNIIYKYYLKNNSFLINDNLFLIKNIKFLKYYLKINYNNNYKKYNKITLKKIYISIMENNKNFSYILISYLINDKKNNDFPIRWN
ncbi:hypothetical protein ACWNYI_00630 [Candidatus Vidania fulgoroideorum]